MAESFFKTGAAIEAMLSEEFDDIHLTYPNQPYTPVAGTPWGRVAILPATANRLVMTGSPNTGQEVVGFVVVQIFVPQNTGTGALKTYADTLRGLLNERRLEVDPGKTLSLGPVEFQVIGGSGNWFQGNVTARFEYLET